MSVASRHHPPTSSTSYRTPRKSSSFLSLRREKDKPTPVPDIYPSFDAPGSSHRTPTTYFDAYPRPKSSPITRSVKTKTRKTSTTDSIAHPLESSVPKRSTVATSYAFPSFDADEEYRTPSSVPYTRTRSRTGPSGKARWEETTSVPQLRFSGSSSTQNTETPPRTPVDYANSKESFENFPVLVAAPVSGVEMMDALVDGMNGGDILSASTSISNRARYGIPGHHPLYQPPLPTPPPGVVLGGGKIRHSRATRRSSVSSDSGHEEDFRRISPSPRTPRRRAHPSSSTRTASSSTIKVPTASIYSSNNSQEVSPSSDTKYASDNRAYRSAGSENRKSVVPSISDIIRAHAPMESKSRSVMRSSSLYTHSQGHGTLHEGVESEPESLTREEEVELISRSSIDSVADEVQRTLRNQVIHIPPPSVPPSAFHNRHSIISDNASMYSPRSDPGAGSSIYSFSVASNYQSSLPHDTNPIFSSFTKSSPSQAVAQYIRSTRLTTLLKLTRSPHASQDNPLTVSLSDLGCLNGFPVVVFLGLGCVRHIMGLYDEMAECMGLRLITIDRWGLGRTEPRAKSAKGIMQWASVVEEILDLLQIGQCSIIAHSAGAPYALSFANKTPSRIKGDICLLAPWVGGSGSNGYKWLKYVPNGLLKTAQAAEWKLQAWMIGKPPTIAYEGIGYNASQSASSTPARSASSPRPSTSLHPSVVEGIPRPSIGSSTFSEYDDLGDFEGRFESHSTSGGRFNPSSAANPGEIFTTKRKTSRGFLDLLKGNPAQFPSEDKQASGKRLKALRSMGSLKGKNNARKSEPSSPQLPPTLHFDIDLRLEELQWSRANDSVLSTSPTPRASTGNYDIPRSSGRRSISFTSPKATLSMPSSPAPSTVTTSFTPVTGSSSYQAALGNALIAASHAESAGGTHNDLLQILNHENHSWGFSYSAYPHNVKVWYGDKDEKIAENAVRWMERTMGNDRCSVKVVKGADHGLMYRSSVVIDVLERVLAVWRSDP